MKNRMQIYFSKEEIKFISEQPKGFVRQCVQLIMEKMREHRDTK